MEITSPKILSQKNSATYTMHLYRATYTMHPRGFCVPVSAMPYVTPLWTYEAALYWVRPLVHLAQCCLHWLTMNLQNPRRELSQLYLETQVIEPGTFCRQRMWICWMKWWSRDCDCIPQLLWSQVVGAGMEWVRIGAGYNACALHPFNSSSTCWVRLYIHLALCFQGILPACYLISV